MSLDSFLGGATAPVKKVYLDKETGPPEAEKVEPIPFPPRVRISDVCTRHETCPDWCLGDDPKGDA